MKKTLLTLLLTASFAAAQTLVSSYSSGYITSEVYEMLGGAYHYSYTANSKYGKKDISNITIDLCTNDTFGAYGSDPFELDNKPFSIKFDSIDISDDVFNFGFYSYTAPSVNNANLKYGSNIISNNVLSTGCIPETSTMSYLFGSAALLLYRRRRTL